MPQDQKRWNGGIQLIKVTLRNPLCKEDLLTYYISPFTNALAQDWVIALEKIIDNKLLLEKNFCFLGFPNTARSVEYLCDQLNSHVKRINQYFGGHYTIEEYFDPTQIVADDLGPNHTLLNTLHNHFERLQGTVENLSEYYRSANDQCKFSIRQLNNICHELESLILSRRKQIKDPLWIRPSQITTWLTAPRYDLKDEHRLGFLTNGYARDFGTVYMHWCQIGKTYFEVWRDENAPKLTSTICEAITPLKYYSGEFDIEWGRSVNYSMSWWQKELEPFYSWLRDENIDVLDTKNSLGHLPVGTVLLEKSFGTTDPDKIWNILEHHLDIYSVEVNGKTAVYDYVWSDSDYEDLQIKMLKPGYRYQSRTSNEMA